MTEDKGNGFFRGATHRVILGSPTLQSSNRRICVPLRMPLTGESFADMPDWICTAYDAVAKSFPSVDAPVDVISDITLAFHNGKPNDKLFAEPSAKVPHRSLRSLFVCAPRTRTTPTSNCNSRHTPAIAAITGSGWARLQGLRPTSTWLFLQPWASCSPPRLSLGCWTWMKKRATHSILSAAGTKM